MNIEGIYALTGEAIRLSIEKGRIVALENIIHTDQKNYISPGFFDIQVNGYRGIDYSGDNLKGDEVISLVTYLAQHGTTQHVPTIITNSPSRICKNLGTVTRERKKNPLLQEAIPGFHIEGPFISEKDGTRGAHDPKYIRDPSIDELDEWMEISEGLIKIVTIAPEREGAMQFIKNATRRNIVVSIGHTAASGDVIQEAVQAGAKLSTHLGNGSQAMIPRLQNYIWEQLATDDLCASIISDAFHLPKSVLKVITRAKGLDRLILISDVAPLGGKEKGFYKWGDMDIEVHEDGHLSLAHTPYLAGAGHLLDTCIPHFVRSTGISLADSIRMVSTNPKHLISIKAKEESLFTDFKHANLTVFQWDGLDSKFSIKLTLIAGQPVFSAL